MKNTIDTSDNPFTQLCVWQGCTLGDDTPKDFEDFMGTQGMRVKFDSTQLTNPDRDESGEVEPETGGRSDLFFYLHSGDIGKAAIKRIVLGIHWWEDVLDNGYGYLYSEEFKAAHPKAW